jgi:hypothetical protein
MVAMCLNKDSKTTGEQAEKCPKGRAATKCGTSMSYLHLISKTSQARQPNDGITKKTPGAQNRASLHLTRQDRRRARSPETESARTHVHITSTRVRIHCCVLPRMQSEARKSPSAAANRERQVGGWHRESCCG